MLRIHLAVVCVCVLAVACSSPPPAGPPPGDAAAKRVTALADAYVKDYFEAFPHYALANGAPEVHPDRLVDHSLPALKRWQDREDELLAELKQIDLASVEGRPEAVTYKFLQNLLETAQGYRVCRIELWNVSPTWTGWQAEMPVIAGMQATASADNQRNALARFSQVAEVPRRRDRESEGRPEAGVHGAEAQRAVRDRPDGRDARGAARRVAVRPDGQGGHAGVPQASSRSLEQAQIRPAIQRYRDFLQTTYWRRRARRLASAQSERSGLLRRPREVSRDGRDDAESRCTTSVWRRWRRSRPR